MGLESSSVHFRILLWGGWGWQMPFPKKPEDIYWLCKLILMVGTPIPEGNGGGGGLEINSLVLPFWILRPMKGER